MFHFSREGDSSPCLDSLFQCSVIRTVKCFFILRGRSLCISFCALPLAPLLGTTGKSRDPSSFWHSSFSYLWAMTRSPRLFPPAVMEFSRPTNILKTEVLPIALEKG